MINIFYIRQENPLFRTCRCVRSIVVTGVVSTSRHLPMSKAGAASGHCSEHFLYLY